MILSMTGYGSASSENDALACTIEIKALNSKFLDINCRIPRGYHDKEVEIRNLITQKIERGKIEINVNISPKTEAHAQKINRPLLAANYADMAGAFKELNIPIDASELVKVLLTMPNMLVSDVLDEGLIEKENQLIFNVLNTAIEHVTDFRAQEGRNTAAKFAEYINIIEQNLRQIESMDADRILTVKERIRKHLGEWMSSDNFDANRFEQELIYYVEKFDISEEKVRLQNHIDYFRKELSLSSNGKKLNFIAQELGREINTIGSKANHADIQVHVVQMKDELEKIKEQTMNIL